jgi:hypothetical protein
MKVRILIVGLLVLLGTTASLLWAAETTATEKTTVKTVTGEDGITCEALCEGLEPGQTKCVVIKCDDSGKCQDIKATLEGIEELNIDEMIKSGDAIKIEDGKCTKIVVIKGATKEEKEKILQELEKKSEKAK